MLILGTELGLRANCKVPQGSDMPRAPWSSFIFSTVVQRTKLSHGKKNKNFIGLYFAFDLEQNLILPERQYLTPDANQDVGGGKFYPNIC